jgi:hypothetical protein
MTLDSLTRQIDKLLAEIHQRQPREREPLDISVLPEDEQDSLQAFLATIQDKVDMASEWPYKHLSDEELDTLKTWTTRLQAMQPGREYKA